MLLSAKNSYLQNVHAVMVLICKTVVHGKGAFGKDFHLRKMTFFKASNLRNTTLVKALHLRNFAFGKSRHL